VLGSCGADEELNATLGPLRCPAQAGFDVALTVDADKPPSSPGAVDVQSSAFADMFLHRCAASNLNMLHA
jgi:hypothetical protein